MVVGGIAGLAVLAVAGWLVLGRGGSTAIQPPAGGAATEQAAAAQPSGATGAQQPGGAPPAAVTGHVALSNVPADARITVDGQPAAGPEMDLPPGPHDIGVRAAGYDPFSTAVVVVAGKSQSVSFSARRVAAARTPTRARAPVEPTPRPRRPVPVAERRPETRPAAQLAVLKMRIQPWAMVTLNSKHLGQRSQLVDTLIPGTALLHLEREGYITLDTTLTLSAGENPPILIRMKPRSP